MISTILAPNIAPLRAEKELKMAKSKNVVTQIRKATRRKFSADEKIRIVLEGLRGENTISEICRREGHLAYYGPLVVRTGQHTGRSAKDKFIVREPSSQDKVWWGDVNNAMDQEHFDSLHHRLLAYWQGKDLFVHERVFCIL